MSRFRNGLLNKTRNKTTDRHGMTMAEMLIAVAIIIILAAVAFISVMQYQRTLAQLERDKIAQEIFVAAQNHLTVSQGEAYLGLKDDKNGTADSEDGVYHFIYPGDSYSTSNETVLDLMLPFGSIDETVRTGGSYIIKYHKNTGRVLDVFYCTRSGSPDKFNHILRKAEAGTENDYVDANAIRGSSNKGERRSWARTEGGKTKNTVLGWYGGDDANKLGHIKLAEPTLVVKNEEKLSVEVTDKNTDNSGKYSIRLIITGETSGAKKSYVLCTSSGSSETEYTGERISNSSNKYTIVLDDITKADMHFGNIDSENEDGSKFIPGENIKIQAVCYSLTKFANIAFSAEKITNSLFEDIAMDGVTKYNTAYINNFRHFENMDEQISHLNANNETKSSKLSIEKGIQTADLIWDDGVDTTTDDFVSAVGGSPVIHRYRAASTDTDVKTTAGYYMPVDMTSFSYDGKGLSITGVKTDANDAANSGLFGTIAGSTAKNIKLVDFNINGSATAGALAGTVKTNDNGTASTITNILVKNTNNNSGLANVKATTAGGLIGEISSGTVSFCAAAVIVGGDSTTTAGGLIGKASGGTVTGCYSGGHTKGGSYVDWVEETGHSYDVKGTTAGGLIGSSAATVSYSYSTCSVDGSSNAGGFVGSAVSGSSIKDSYATGLVKIDNITQKEDYDKNKQKGAFAGSNNGSIVKETDDDDCMYYSIINEVKLETTQGGSKTSVDHYLGSVSDSKDKVSHISALDETAESYDNFVPGTWKPAEPYDKTSGSTKGLDTYYGGKYNLKTVQQLGAAQPDGYEWANLFVNTHYGDWPAPEIFIINN